MVSIFFWVAFGTIIGWIAAILRDVTHTRKVGAFMAAGALGGVAGGFSGLLLSPTDMAATVHIDFTFALFGAIVFVFIAGFAAQKHSENKQ